MTVSRDLERLRVLRREVEGEQRLTDGDVGLQSHGHGHQPLARR